MSNYHNSPLIEITTYPPFANIDAVKKIDRMVDFNTFLRKLLNITQSMLLQRSSTRLADHVLRSGTITSHWFRFRVVDKLHVQL